MLKHLQQRRVHPFSRKILGKTALTISVFLIPSWNFLPCNLRHFFFFSELCLIFLKTATLSLHSLFQDKYIQQLQLFLINFSFQVVLLWIPSSLSTSFLKFGAQKWTQYYRWGLSNILDAGWKGSMIFLDFDTAVDGS